MLPDSKPSKTSCTADFTAAVMAPGEAGRGVGVGPFQIEPHMSGRLAMSGSVVYCVAHEAVNALPPRRTSRKPRMPEASLDNAVAVHFQARGGALGAGGRKGDGAGESRHRESPRPRSARLPPADRSRETSRQGSDNSLRDRRRVIQRLALDEILHRIGRDQAGVVAGGVSGPERIAINQDLDVSAEEWLCRWTAIQAVDVTSPLP